MALAALFASRQSSNRASTSAAANSDASSGAQHRKRSSRESLARDPDPVGTLRLEGQVIDADQHGVAGAVVSISSAPAREITTEDDGSFVIEGLLARSYHLIANHEQATASATVRLRPTSEPVILRLRPALAVIVQVNDASTGLPIAGADVDASGWIEQHAVTDSAGRAVVSALDDMVGIEASAAGYAPADTWITVPNDAGGSIERTLRLSRGAAVSGIVLGPDDQPMAGAYVWAQGAGMVGADEEADEAGRFRFDALASGSYTLSVFSDRYPTSSSEPIEVDGVTPRDGVILRLETGAQIAGDVVDASGAPVAFAAVRAANTFSTRETSADAQGHFVLRGMPRGKLSIVGESDDRSSEHLEVDTASGDLSGLRLVLNNGTISGIVVDAAGEPVAEASVQSFRSSRSEISSLLSGQDEDTTDSAGRFTLGPVTPGEYEVWAVWPGASTRGSYDSRRVVETQTGATDVKIVLPEVGEITGVVVLAGKPVVDYAILGGNRAPEPVMVHSLDGRFTIRGVMPGKSFVAITGDTFETLRKSDIVVESGKRTDLGQIEVTPGRVVRGDVVDMSGARVSGATVVVSTYVSPEGDSLGLNDDTMAGRMGGQYSAVTGVDGTFEIVGVLAPAPDEPLLAMADRPGIGRTTLLTLAESQSELHLVLQATGTIRGRTTGGTEMDQIQAFLVDGGPTNTTWADMAGRYRLGGLTPGRYYVGASTGAMSERATPTQLVDVVAGSTATVDLAFLSGPITLEVRLGDIDCYELSIQLAKSVVENDQIALATCDGGTAEVSGLPPGDYKVCLANDACTPVTLTASPAQQTLDLSK